MTSGPYLTKDLHSRGPRSHFAKLFTIMKPIPSFLAAAAFIAAPVFAQPTPAPSAAADPFEAGMRDTFAAYKKGEMETVSGKLHELITIVTQKTSAKIALLLTDKVGDWKGDPLEPRGPEFPEDVAAAVRSYTSGDHRITVRIVRNQLMVEQLAPALVNEDLLRAANRNIHKLGPLNGVMDGEHKLEVLVQPKFHIAIEGNEQTPEAELVAFAEMLNLPALLKLK